MFLTAARDAAEAAKGAAEAHCTLATLSLHMFRSRHTGSKPGPNVHASQPQVVISSPYLRQKASSGPRSRTVSHLAAEVHKATKKEAGLHAQELEWVQNAIHKTFDAPLSTYKHKDDL